MSSDDSDSVNLVVIGAVVGGISLVFFLIVLCLCRRLIRRTSADGRRNAMLKAHYRTKGPAEVPKDEEDEGDGEGVPELTLPLRRRDDDDDDDFAFHGAESNLERFAGDPAELARNGLYLPKASALREPPRSRGAVYKHVASPGQRGELKDPPQYEPPKIVWNDATESFEYFSLAHDESATHSATVAVKEEIREPVGRFVGVSPTFQPHRPLSLSASRTSRWQYFAGFGDGFHTNEVQSRYDK